MKNKVYYGEYSLHHWIDLLLAGNITLPKYQRSFVWKDDAIKDFIESLKKNEFIPPVIIGNFGGNINYIIDGQQRLTSLLLAYFGKIPHKEAFKAKDIIQYANPDDLEADEDDEGNQPIEWNFSFLIQKNHQNTKESVLQTINEKYSDKYYDYAEDITNIWDDTYLGFSFIIPLEKDQEQQKFYCSVFKNINIRGTSLLPQESRRSLYFLDSSKQNFFDWNGLSQYKISNKNESRQIDFIRFVSISSQYAKELKIQDIMKRYAPRGGKDEDYYARYIADAINSPEDSIFKPFSEIFPENNYTSRLERLTTTLNQLDIPQEYKSIVDVDITFFGLIFYILIQNDNVDITKKNTLHKELASKIDTYKDKNGNYERNPNLLKNIRKRFKDSIDLYQNFIVKDS